jgi:hypothetical protein
MSNKAKDLSFNLANILVGGFALFPKDNILRGFAQTGIDFCETCGKVLDRPGDQSSIKRGAICLECKIEADQVSIAD